MCPSDGRSACADLRFERESKDRDLKIEQEQKERREAMYGEVQEGSRRGAAQASIEEMEEREKRRAEAAAKKKVRRRPIDKGQ